MTKRGLPMTLTTSNTAGGGEGAKGVLGVKLMEVLEAAAVNRIGSLLYFLLLTSMSSLSVCRFVSLRLAKEPQA